MILIDMNMPQSCQDCPAFATEACDKWVKHKTFSDQRTKRHKDCPIVAECTGIKKPNEDECGNCKYKHLWDVVMNDLDNYILHGAEPKQETCATCLYNDEPWDSDPCEECMDGNSHYTEISYDIQK